MTFGSTGTASTARRRGRRILWGGGSLLALGALVSLGACSTSGSSTSPGGSTAAGHAAQAPTSAVDDAAAAITAASGVRNGMSPTAPVSLSVAHGRLTSVTMTNQSGKHVTSTMGSGDTTWHTTEVLGYGKTYTITARAVNAQQQPATRTVKFTTLDPKRTINASMERMGGYGLAHSLYGVGIIPVVHFDAAVGNKKAAQQALTVKSSRSVHGVWSWVDSQDVAYRPQGYWPADTKVSVTADVYGVNLGHSAYGASDEGTSFTIGRKQMTVADDNAPNGVDKVRVYNSAGKVLRTMNTSMGKHGGETLSNGTYINFYTLRGNYTVLDHENPAHMSSQSYGLPANAPSGYGTLDVPYSTKISVDGIYLHEFNSTIYDQDHGEDVSEGCLNLRTSDAVWFYDHSLAGDPVTVHGAKGAPTIEPWEGGYWSIPWSTWTKNSAV